MASIYNKFLDFIGIEESEENEEPQEEEYYEERDDDRRAFSRDRDRDREREREPRTPAPAVARRSEKTATSTGANLPISGGMKMIVYHPVSYEDTQAIIDNLKNRKPVIVNMEELEVDAAQRILDFLSGAVYALSGTMCKISRGIFVVAPNNYDVIGNGEDEYDDMV